MNESRDFLVERLAECMLARDLKLVVAESCTGGGIAKAMTNLAGSSGWFERGYVTYSNEAKLELLNVSREILETYGAVSTETAIAMSEGALANSHAQVSVAVTGIAGPEGGTTEKPVGTVCFAWSMQNNDTVSTSTVFTGDRQTVRERSILMAIQGLVEIVEKY